MTIRRELRVLCCAGVALGMVVGLMATASRARATEGKSDSSLYKAFGERAGIEAIVEDFMRRATSDPRVKDRFQVVTPKLKGMMADQMCQATGGPCTYRGRDMKTAHTGMHINDAEYDALTEDLVAALDAQKVPKEAQAKFLAARNKNREAIVDKVAQGATPAAATSPAPAAQGGAVGLSPTLRRARDFQDAAKILEMVDDARTKGNSSLATALFASVELLVGSAAVSDLYPFYNKGAPHRVTAGESAVADGASNKPQPKLVPLPDEAPPPPTPAEAAKPKEPRAPSNATVNGKLVVGGKVLSEGVGLVMLKPLDRPAKPRPAQVRTMEQRGRDFAPHLLVVPVGSTVNFPNFDPIYHNVYSSSDVKAFDLGVYRNGESRAVVFDQPGIIQVECSVHENMLAYIAVVSEPYAAIVSDGSFTVKNVPPGKYRVRAWTEHSGKVLEKEIVVKGGDNTLAVEVDAKGNGRQRTDKFGNPRNK
jgi:truncated hemoglobin YjbI/plastocyanin